MRLGRAAFGAITSIAAFAACARAGSDASESSSGLENPPGHIQEAGPPDSSGTTPPSCAGSISEQLAYTPLGCGDHVLERGVWRGRSLFPEAPATVRDRACVFRWDAADGTLPTVRELSELVNSVPYAYPSCEVGGASTTTGSAGALHPYEPPPPSGLSDGGASDASTGPPPTGVSGCDVCGQVVSARLYLMMPAATGQATVTLRSTTGERYEMAVVLQDRDRSGVSVDLPPAPSGTWLEGLVHIDY